MDHSKLSKNTELLKNESKHIRCDYIGREDQCPDSCDNCAISLKTFGDMALMQGDAKQALISYLEAVAKNSTFAEAWNNMGNAYANLENYHKALEAFNIALMIDPVYGKAMLGKALTLKNLQRLPEAIEVLDSVLGLYDNDYCKRLRFEIVEQMSKEIVISNKQSLDALFTTIRDILISEACKTGYLKDGFPFVPELYAISTDCLVNIYQGMSKLADGLSIPLTSLKWAFYGGFGAAYHWQLDWQYLQEKGIYQTLTNERGIEEMDEYVIDLSGIKWGSRGSKKLIKFVDQCAVVAIQKATVNFTINDPKDFVDRIIVAMQAQFSLGVGVALNRIGKNKIKEDHVDWAHL